MTRSAGIKTGLKITKSGAVMARLTSVPVRVRPARSKRKAPTGKRVTTARTCEEEGPFSLPGSHGNAVNALLVLE
ncbi:hypothetical protein O6P43_030838 [Quillaja saponaria]|uniref:Uncharacterized protein n=1 Tax=Quillaja saponaria TaxID=32244 RepID=A0AAD7KU34_QUISA|nr:hypothetical protein O6P43_030838 [Quillaja saponaria]